MIGADVTITADFQKAIGPQSAPVVKAKFNSFVHAGSSIRKDAMGSIQNAPSKKRAKRTKNRSGKGTRVIRRATHEASRPGTPPYTQRGQLRRAIVFAADKQEVIIGPRGSVTGESALAHEFGVKYKGGDYPARPFMGPAMDRNLYRFGQSWQGSIGQ